MQESKLKGFQSLCLHAGHESESGRAHLTPIYATSTYTFDSAEQSVALFEGREPGYVYSRFGHPNALELERKISALEAFELKDSRGEPLSLFALAHSSGMGAISTVFLHHLRPGDKVLATHNLYGGTQELVDKILAPHGISLINRALDQPSEIDQALEGDPEIKMLYLETPTNPMVRCYDLEALSRKAKERGLLVCVDNTIATPYLQQPFRYAVDYVVHSSTKFLNGHGTAVGGLLLGRSDSGNQESLTKTHRLLGAQSSPFDAYLLIQGIKTLPLRMEKQCLQAQRVAEFLSTHPAVSRVYYLGLESHPDHALAKKQMRLPGAVLSFELKGGQDAAFAFLNRVKVCVSAVSLGTCDTLVCHPASSTHRGVDPAIREFSGLSDGLIRMSVGLEDFEDLAADIDQALDSPAISQQ